MTVPSTISQFQARLILSSFIKINIMTHTIVLVIIVGILPPTTAGASMAVCCRRDSPEPAS